MQGYSIKYKVDASLWTVNSSDSDAMEVKPCDECVVISISDDDDATADDATADDATPDDATAEDASAHDKDGNFGAPVKTDRSNSVKSDSIKIDENEVQHSARYFETKPHLKEHSDKRQVLHNPEVRCMICNHLFQSQFELQEHQLSGHYELFCSCCSKWFQSKLLLREHKAHVRVKQLFVCDICSRSFQTQLLFEKHKVLSCDTYSSVTPLYTCKRCGAEFTNENTYQRHIRHWHRDQKTFTCPVCEMSFKWRFDLTTHKKMAHSKRILQKYRKGRRPGKFVCEICSQHFRTEKNYESHKRKHNEHGGCAMCHEIFRTELDVQYHDCSDNMVIQEGNPFICGICDACFNCKVDILSHMRLHTGELAFGCETCKLGFGNQKELKWHTQLARKEMIASCKT